MGFLSKILSGLEEDAPQIENTVANKVENSAANKSYGAADDSFNSPKFKVDDTPVDPEDFSQAAAADREVKTRPTNWTKGDVNSTPVDDSKALVPRNKAQVPSDPKLQNFETVGEPQSKDFELLDPEPSGNFPAMRDVSQVPSIADQTADDTTSFLQKYGKPAAYVAGGAAGLGLGAAALSGSDQQQVMGEPGKMLKPGSDVQPSTDGTTDYGDDDSTDGDASPKTKATPLKAGDAPVKARGIANAQPAAQQAAAQVKDAGPVLNFGNNNVDTAGMLQDAQKRQNQAVLTNELGRAASIVGAGIARTNPNQDALKGFDDNIKSAEQIVPQQQALIEKMKDDPNSPVSQGMKSFLTSMGYKIQGNPSASDMQKMTPLAEKYMQHIEDLQNKKQMASDKLDEQKFRDKQFALQKQIADQARSDSRDSKQAAADTKRIDTANKLITSEIASSRSAFGKAAGNRQAVDNAQALLDGELDYNQLDNRQVTELARVMDRVLSGGNATISGTEHLTPESARQKLAKYEEMITSKRQGAGAGSFVNTMAQTLQREKDQADNQIRNTQGAILGSYSDLKDNPTMKDTLRSHGLDPDTIWQPPVKKLSASDQIKQIMTKNPGMSFDQAHQQYNNANNPNAPVMVQLPNGKIMRGTKAKLNNFLQDNPGAKVLNGN